MRTYYVEYELDEWVGKERSYAGPHTAVIHAKSPDDAYEVFCAYLRDNDLMLAEDSSYGIHNIPQKRGMAKISGFVGP
jgi:hypothetical protein